MGDKRGLNLSVSAAIAEDLLGQAQRLVRKVFKYKDYADYKCQCRVILDTEDFRLAI